MSATAQKHEGPRTGKSAKADMTAAQIATLHTKKLTLALDLSQGQQKQVMQISLEEAEMRKTKHEEIRAKKESGVWKKPTAEERFEIENARLDYQIAQHQKMKKVLSDEQYQTWKKLKLRKAMNGKKKMQEKGRRG
ncbi:hypothetical protein DKG77_06520 [Flagellimonas aquimarina]|uniref:DUF4890 domain-containing protein n=2 Tax=Flagellimonas aquimarina TaxID=2201895 RepID=A0A316L6B9_9FLAO|nr:hypothetical protein DKG77_06520 [Allomuricauda koreensis]